MLSDIIINKKGVKQALLDTGKNLISEFVRNTPVTGRSKKVKRALRKPVGNEES